MDERYDMRLPSAVNAIDIFDDEWSSAFPTINEGKPKFYDDPRLHFFERASGGFSGKRILELGPLEGAHSLMLQTRGAGSVVSIEANTRAYLKCLIIKNIYSLDKVNFILGDFGKYLSGSVNFDTCIACGVLYHMSDPVALIEGMCRSSSTVCIWTHYYDEEIIRGREDLRPRFGERETSNYRGVDVVTSAQTYIQEVLDWRGFCGGAERVTRWIERDSMLAVFDALGFDVEVDQDEPLHPNGPAITFVAKKRT
ncbi:class I SAM-dependent methyltransferase [Stappia sp.]|uniref:class I SAM-dependent methyltransferase n=1 Tax=Stappia sp. TaxID=1870903 RepID=UPI003D11F36E